MPSCAPRPTALRERVREGESLDDLLPEAFALTREASRRTLGQRHYDVQLVGGMVLHDGSIAEMKTGEGKTLTATLAVFLNTLAGDGVHVVTVNDYLARRDAEWMAPIYEALGVSVAAIQEDDDHDGAAAEIRLRRHLRDQLGVRLRLPARQHGGGEGALRPARPPFRDRGRGRQHPDRRGAHAADHLRRARAGGADLLHVRPPRQADGRRPGQRQAAIAGRVQGHLRGRLRLRVRREAQDRRADRARRQTGGGIPRRRQPLPERARHPRQPPRAGAQGRVALQDGQGLRGRRRRGDDHRRVHRPHPRGPALVGGPAPGGRGEGGRRDRRGEPDPGDDHPAELLPPLRQARRDDRHRPDRGDRVHEDLQSAGGRDADQPADGPRRPQRPDLQDQGRQVEGGARGNHRPPRDRPADPRRHRLGRGLGNDLGRAEAPRRSSTRCSTPSPSTPNERASGSPRRAARAR